MIATPAEIELVRSAKAAALHVIERGRSTAGPLDVAMLRAACDAAKAEGRSPTGIVTLLSEIHQDTRVTVERVGVFGETLRRQDVTMFAQRCIERCEMVERNEPGWRAWGKR